jgi:hypothetical protein
MSMMWTDNGSVLRGSYNGSTSVWSSPVLVASGTNGGEGVNMVPLASDPNYSKVVWRKTSWPLSFAFTGMTGGGGGGAGSLNPVGLISASSQNEDEIPLPFVRTKHALVDAAGALEALEISSSKSTVTPSGSIGYEIKSVFLGNTAVSLIHPDTLDGEDLSTTVAFKLTSEPLTITGLLYGKSLFIPEEYKDHLPVLAQALVRDSETGDVLKTVSLAQSSDLTESIANDFGAAKSVTLDLGDLEGREVFVQILMIGQSAGVAPVLVENCLINGETLVPGSPAQPITSSGPQGPPQGFSLDQNYPNPFNPDTKISFHLNEPGHLRLEIFDILGSRVALLADGYRSAGYHSATWRISDGSSGTFIYRLTFNGESGLSKTLSRKMIVAK